MAGAQQPHPVEGEGAVASLRSEVVVEPHPYPAPARRAQAEAAGAVEAAEAAGMRVAGTGVAE